MSMTAAPVSAALLIRHAELLDGRTADVRIRHGRITEIETCLPIATHDPVEHVIDAAGGLLLPGLHDHHAHIAATAAAISSIRCGPPEVENAQALAAALAVPGEDWLRGIGYHESVTGHLIDRHWLDRAAPGRPVRVQHRSGRMWIFNSAGLDQLLAAGPPVPDSLEREAGQFTGRLYDDDFFLRRALGSAPPSFEAAGSAFARYGITGVTEMSPANDDAIAAHFAREHWRGALPQRVLLAGKLELGNNGLDPAIALGPFKLHLHEEHLPELDAMVAAIRAAHAKGRNVAVHCVTEVELVFTLAAIREAGAWPGDRIEHASVTPDHLLTGIAELGLAVVAQPHFVAERGDAYLAGIPPAEWPHLYRLRAFRSAGIALAGGSDTPFGSADPWAAMAAAVTRRTAHGQLLGITEALTPEEALELFLADPTDLGRTRIIAPDAPADLCLLTRPWKTVREALNAGFVRATFIDGKRLDGRLVHNSVDQPPTQSGLRTDTLAR
jgi:predicted amidohydrolase YtcJ